MRVGSGEGGQGGATRGSGKGCKLTKFQVLMEVVEKNDEILNA